jgi:hypothetical protein
MPRQAWWGEGSAPSQSKGQSIYDVKTGFDCAGGCGATNQPGGMLSQIQIDPETKKVLHYCVKCRPNKVMQMGVVG